MPIEHEKALANRDAAEKSPDVHLVQPPSVHCGLADVMHQLLPLAGHVRGTWMTAPTLKSAPPSAMVNFLPSFPLAMHRVMHLAESLALTRTNTRPQAAS